MVRKSLVNIAFPHFSGTVADANGTSHLLIMGKIDFILIGLTQDYGIPIKIAKKNPRLKQAVMQWLTDIYILLQFTSNSTLQTMYRVHSRQDPTEK